MKVGDLVKAIPGAQPAGVVGVIVDNWWHPNTGMKGFRVFFPGTAHRSDTHTDIHAIYAGRLEVISEGR